MTIAIERAPESFGQVAMLYINWNQRASSEGLCRLGGQMTNHEQRSVPGDAACHTAGGSAVGTGSLKAWARSGILGEST